MSQTEIVVCHNKMWFDRKWKMWKLVFILTFGIFDKGYHNYVKLNRALDNYYKIILFVKYTADHITDQHFLLKHNSVWWDY